MEHPLKIFYQCKLFLEECFLKVVSSSTQKWSQVSYHELDALLSLLNEIQAFLESTEADSTLEYEAGWLPNLTFLACNWITWTYSFRGKIKTWYYQHCESQFTFSRWKIKDFTSVVQILKSHAGAADFSFFYWVYISSVTSCLNIAMNLQTDSVTQRNLSSGWALLQTPSWIYTSS